MTSELEALAASDHDLTLEECTALAARAAAEIDYRSYVRAGEHRRIYERLWQNEHSEAWLTSFWDARDTGYHDHDGSCGSVHVVEGRVTEEPLVVGRPARVREYGPGDTFAFDGSHIHRMHHDPEAVTIHLYSPPIGRIGSYEVVDGELRRTPGSPDEESPETPELDGALGR
jgi:Cysteine dioxygenase type I